MDTARKKITNHNTNHRQLLSAAAENPCFSRFQQKLKRLASCIVMTNLITATVAALTFRPLMRLRYPVCVQITRTCMHTHTHTHTTVLRLFGFCPGQPGLAGTRRNIHPLRPIVIIKYPYLLPASDTIHGILHIQSMRFTVFFHNLCPSFLWSTSWPGTLHFILHTFLHPIIIFFSQHMPIPSQPVLL